MPIQKFKVSVDKDWYLAWPDLVQTNSGKLICVFTQCVHHVDRTGSRIVYCESTDRGRNWSEPKGLTVRGSKTEHFNCARISKLRDGKLVILVDKCYGNERGGLKEMYYWVSDSEGTRWEGPAKLPFHGYCPDKLLQLENGRILVAAQDYQYAEGNLEQYLWYSDDNMQTWSEKVVMAADSRYNLCEVSILPCGEGTLVAFLRENSRKGYPVLKVISKDNGQTWSDIYETPMDCGHRPISGFLHDGRVMITYRYIPYWQQNLFTAFMDSKYLFETDRQYNMRIMPLDYDRSSAPDLGYTGWTQFEDGEIYVVTYIKDDAPKAQIRGYSFYPSDVVLPPIEDMRNPFED